jgi:hypothetical protein
VIDPLTPIDRPTMSVALLLADAAQVADGRLYVLGGGLTSVGPRPQPLAIALVLSVPWALSAEPHRWALELLHEDGTPAPDAGRAVTVTGRLEACEPPESGTRPVRSVPLAVNFATLPLEPGRGYVWRLRIDEQTRPEWHAPFHVAADRTQH